MLCESAFEHTRFRETREPMMKEDFMATDDRIHLDPQDLSAIDQLAQKMRQPTEKVKRIYAGVISGLRSGAQIQSFLTLITSKKVRNILRKTGTRQA
jgi:hypothetical protein